MIDPTQMYCTDYKTQAILSFFFLFLSFENMHGLLVFSNFSDGLKSPKRRVEVKSVCIFYLQSVFVKNKPSWRIKLLLLRDVYHYSQDPGEMRCATPSTKQNNSPQIIAFQQAQQQSLKEGTWAFGGPMHVHLLFLLFLLCGELINSLWKEEKSKKMETKSNRKEGRIRSRHM